MVLLFLSCNNKNNEHLSMMPLLEVVMPQSLNNQIAVEEWVRETEQTMNGLSETIHQILKDNHKIINKEKDKMTMKEKIQYMALTGQLTLSFTEFHQFFDAQIIKKDSFLTELSDDQVSDLKNLWFSFSERMELLEKKFQMVQEKQ